MLLSQQGNCAHIH